MRSNTKSGIYPFDLRLHEFKAVGQFFDDRHRVLEVGAGNGYQAALLASAGCEVEAVDVEASADNQEVYFAVTLFDGKNLPFPADSFDRVFSSNALEHAQDLPALLSSVKMILRDNGLVICILPSVTWRLWTSIAHYLFLLKFSILRGKMPIFSRRSASIADIGRAKGVGYVVKRILLAGPHGEFSNAFVELWEFSRYRWLRRFQAAEFEVMESFPSNLFYTGYRLLPGMSIESRKRLARCFGSSSRIYVCRKSNG